ncbi:MAG: CGNR zinc finger domain-containing protein, partial [Dehalococcoidia bacterium]
WVRGPAAANGVQDGTPEVTATTGETIRRLGGDGPATVEGVATARDVRDALLVLLLGDGHGAPIDLDALLARLPVRLRATAEGRIDLEAAGTGPTAVAAAALLAAHDLAVEGAWERLRLCRADDCHWAYFDRSKNRSRVWCDMKVCGARAKARAYRDRRRTT